MKPNLWLLVNPSIACPVRHRDNVARGPQGGPPPVLQEDHTVPLSLTARSRPRVLFNEMLLVEEAPLNASFHTMCLLSKL